MLKSINPKTESLTYNKLSPEEQASKGILGVLTGVIADCTEATRNGRKYLKDLWEKVFENEIIKEKIENRCLFGELGHPADRQEVDMEKVCICMSSYPRVGTDGKLYGTFDILDTPNGRILKTFCDYGCNIGVSSRGSGDTYTDDDGTEIVDPDTYDCECWDAVLIPAVKSARMSYVTESLNNSKTLRTALVESLNKENADGKRIVESTLKELGIEYKSSGEIETEQLGEDETQEVGDTEASLVTQLQEALIENQKLQKEILSLNEKLSVSYTKETQLQEQNSTLKGTVKKLTESVAKAKVQNTKLTVKKDDLQEALNVSKRHKNSLEVMRGTCKKLTDENKSLQESYDKQSNEIVQLKEQVQLEKRKAVSTKRVSESKIQKLTEQLELAKKDSQIKSSQNENKVRELTALVEKYKGISQKAVNKYIESKATMYGISTDTIHKQLGDSISFSKIDKLCEDLKSYQKRMNKLPFSMSDNKPTKKAVMKEDISSKVVNPDDLIDGSLMNIL